MRSAGKSRSTNRGAITWDRRIIDDRPQVMDGGRQIFGMLSAAHRLIPVI